MPDKRRTVYEPDALRFATTKEANGLHVHQVQLAQIEHHLQTASLDLLLHFLQVFSFHATN